MPELPEVETVARDLHRAVAGATIRDATVHWHRTIRHPQPPERFAAEVAEATIRRVSRRAKTVLLHMEDGRVMTVALRMTGALLVVPEERRPTRTSASPSRWPMGASCGIATFGSSAASACGPAAASRASAPGAVRGRSASRRTVAGTASARSSAATVPSR